jgi:hypothetical protein
MDTFSCFSLLDCSFQALACLFDLRNPHFCDGIIVLCNYLFLWDCRVVRAGDAPFSATLLDAGSDMAYAHEAFMEIQPPNWTILHHFCCSDWNDKLLFNLAVFGEFDRHIRNNGKVRNSCWT